MRLPNVRIAVRGMMIAVVMMNLILALIGQVPPDPDQFYAT